MAYGWVEPTLNQFPHGFGPVPNLISFSLGFDWAGLGARPSWKGVLGNSLSINFLFCLVKMFGLDLDEVKRWNYIVIIHLERGAFGTVYLCQDESGSEVTIKVINLDRYTGGLSSFLL